MRTRIAFAVLIVTFLFIGYWSSAVIRPRLWPRVGEPRSTPAEPAPDGSPGPPREPVQVSIASADVPGCTAEDQAFRAIVDSRWGDERAQNVLVFRWRKAADRDGGLVVHVDGQTMQAPLEPGESFPKVTLTLPLGEVTTKVLLTTFVFKEWDTDGKACFTWEHPPGTPRPYDLDPAPRASLDNAGVLRAGRL